MPFREGAKKIYKQVKHDVKSLFKKTDSTRPNTPSGSLPHTSSVNIYEQAVDDGVNLPGTPPPAQVATSPPTETQSNETPDANSSLEPPFQPSDPMEEHRSDVTESGPRAPEISPHAISTKESHEPVVSQSPPMEHTSVDNVPSNNEPKPNPVEQPACGKLPDDPPGTSTRKDWKQAAAGAAGQVVGTLKVGPFKDISDLLQGFVDTYKATQMEGKVKTEYEALQHRLQSLLQVLETHSDTQASPMVVSKITGIRKLIEGELKSIEKKPSEKPHGRLLMAKEDEEKILACFRRMQEYMDRLSLDTSVSMWKLEEEKSKDRISSSVRLLPSSPSAWYNSSAGAGLKRRECTPGTRIYVIANLLTWANGSSMDAVYWLNGMAGTGKTTIAYSVCKELSDKHTLAASFFCSRLREECRDVNRIIPSIAYQLARFSPAFQSALSAVMEEDQDAHHRVLTEQFQMLIQRPLLTTISNNPLDPVKMVVVIDALDECEDRDSIQDILGLLLKHAVNLPIKFIVSSRPEPQIRDLMIDEQVKAKLVLHELDTGDVQADIETYVREELKPMKPPPAESQIAALVAKAGILFIYAATAVRYIGYDNFRRNPDARLRTLLDAQDGQKTQSKKKNQEIDGLYTTVLGAALNDQGLEDEERSDIEQVLHTVICAYDPLTVSGLSELLQIHNTGRVRAALRPLWSVLHIVGVDELVTTLHASFPDFMLDMARSKAYFCNSEVHNRTLAEHCMERIGRAEPDFNICGLESSYLPDKSISNIEERVNNTVSLGLFYACRYWADHVQAGKCALTLVEKLRDFLCTRLLLWMEVLNLNKQIKTSMGCMKLLVEWCQQLEDDQELVELANDAQRFVESFASNPVSQSTPHIYVSMLAFWPRDAPVARHYAQSTCGPVKAEGTGLDRRQSAHISTWTFKASVTEIAVSQDGRYVALGIEKEVVVVDSSTGQIVLGPLYGLPERIGSIMFSPDQNCILAASKSSNKSHTAIVLGWDTRTGDRVLGPLDLHQNELDVGNAIISPDCACIAVSYNGYLPVLDGSPRTSDAVYTLSLWDTKDGVILHTWETQGWCQEIAFALDGTLVAARCTGSLQVWNTRTGKTVLGPLETVDIEYIAFSPDASRIVHSEDSLNIYVRNSQSEDILHDLSHIRETMAGLRGIRYSPDGRCIAGLSAREEGITPGAIHVWGAIDYQTILGPLKGHTSYISSIAFSPDGSRIISGCDNGLVCTWDVRQRNLPSNSMNTFFIHILSAKFSSDGTRFVTGSKDGLLHIWDSHTGGLSVGPIKAHTSEIAAIDFWNDRVVSGSEDGTVSVWNALSGDVVLASVTTGLKTVIAVAYSPNGDLIVTVSRINFDSEVSLWDAHTTTRVLGPLIYASTNISTIQFSPDGTRIAGIMGIYGSNTVVWDTSDGREVSESHESQIAAQSISYSPNGAFIALGHRHGTTTVWDAYTGIKEPKQLTGHSGWVKSVHFSPDSTRLVSSTHEQIWIWDVQTGQMLFELPHGHGRNIISVAYSPDGTRILSLSMDMSVRIHDARTNQERALSCAATEYSDWTMNQDGWVVDDQSRLLVWVPPDLRRALLQSKTQVAIASWGYVRLKFDKSRMGESWGKSFAS